jgi:hypothetical protein
MSYLVQSVIFDKSKFSLEDARSWLLSNKYKDKGVDEKKNFWRFRQLNPLTIKRKGFSHYITKPLDSSGVELIIAYKEKLEGAGKLNQIKKALFKHFKADEKLEKEVATSLIKANKEADDLLNAFKSHDVADDKPQAQIKKELSKLKSKYISGKGFREKSSIYSKDKMTPQEAKLYMSGILHTGGSLDLTQDVAFRLKYSFKVGELRKMLRELVKEKKIELDLKGISKLKKDEIIDMVVKGKLITPPALPTSVALGKKYKMADLKREVLKHAGLGDFKKADIINYIEKNKLFEVEDQPNIQLTVEEIPKVKKSKKSKKIELIIEEDEEPKDEEMKLVESVPTENPKLQMKGIKVGTRVMPKTLSAKEIIKNAPKNTLTDFIGDIKKDKDDDPELKAWKRKNHDLFRMLMYNISAKSRGEIMKELDIPVNTTEKGTVNFFKAIDEGKTTYKIIDDMIVKYNKRLKKEEEALEKSKEETVEEKKETKKKSKEEKKVEEEKKTEPPKKIWDKVINGITINKKDYPVVGEDETYIYYSPTSVVDADGYLVLKLDDNDKAPLARYDKTKRTPKRYTRKIFGLSLFKADGGDDDILKSDEILAYITDLKNFAPNFEEKKKPEKKDKKEVKLSQTEEALKARYMKDNEYSEEDAIEAVLRDREYQKTIEKLLKEGKFIDETEYPEKPLTKREQGDVREKSYLSGQYERLKKDSAFKKKVEDNQAKLIEAMKMADVDPNTIPRPILSTMIYQSLSFNPKNLREAYDYLNKKVRQHEKYKINE